MAVESLQKLSANDLAPYFKLKGTDGRMHSLHDYTGRKALLVVFMCNHCPYVKAKVGTMNALFLKYAERGVAIVGINPNDPEEYPEDSFENMKIFCEDRGMPFDYLHDETQEVAEAYGAACTPDPFLFDSQFRLAYHGRFNNALSPDAVPSTKEMEDAIDAVLEGRQPENPFLPSMGCSIKWRK